jgi:hypothetical protein
LVERASIVKIERRGSAYRTSRKYLLAEQDYVFAHWDPRNGCMVLSMSLQPDLYNDAAQYDYSVQLSVQDIYRVLGCLVDEGGSRRRKNVLPIIQACSPNLVRLLGLANGLRLVPPKKLKKRAPKV